MISSGRMLSTRPGRALTANERRGYTTFIYICTCVYLYVYIHTPTHTCVCMRREMYEQLRKEYNKKLAVSLANVSVVVC